MSTTDFLKLKLTAATETSMTFLEWRTLMNGVDVDSNMELLDAAISRLNTKADGKADGFTFNPDTGQLQLTSNGEPLPRASVLIDLGSFYTKDEVDSIVNDTAQEASVGTVEWDESTRQLQLYNGKGEPIGEAVTIEGGGGQNSYNYTVKLTNLLDSRAITVAEGSDIEVSFNYSSVDESGNDDGSGVGTVIVNNVRMATVTVTQGDNTLNISRYVGTGENIVKIRVENSEGTAKTMTYTVSVIALNLTTPFDDIGVYSGDVVFNYIPTGSGTKTIHFLMDGVQFGTEEVSSSSRSRSYIVPAQSHGGHTLEVYATVTVGDVTVRSNTLTLGMIWLSNTSVVPAITASFGVTTAKQGEVLTIPYMVYDPTKETTDVVLSVISQDGSVYSSKDVMVDRTVQSWSEREYPIGNVTFKITCGETSVELPVAVSESDLIIEPVTDALEMEFNAIGRSNGEQNPASWSYGDNMAATFEGFGWNAADGWHDDADGNTCLRFLPGSSMTIPLQPFSTDLRSTGATIEVDMSTRDVRDYDSIVLSCFSNGRGFQIASQYAELKTAQSSIRMQFKEDSRVRIVFVIEHRNLNRLIYIYINGVMCGATRYPADDGFTQAPPVDLTIGADTCGIDLYRIRYYSKGLSRSETLDNFIYDQPTLLDQQEAFERNDVLDESDEVVISKLPPDLPYMIFSCPELPQAKGDKKTVEIAYTDPSDTSRSFTATGAQLDVQGTSSQGYKKKNFKFKAKNGIVYTVSTEESDGYQLYNGAIPAAEFTMKADVASSENANNVMLVDYYNVLCPYKTPPQQADSRVRQGIWGRPCVIFWHNTATNETKFWGKYNFNNDKGNNEVFGLTPGCESWEFKNNTSNRVLFKTADFSDSNPDTGWPNDFEARYPEDYTDTTKLQRVIAWVASTDTTAATDEELSTPATYGGAQYTTDSADYRIAKFKAEFEDYFVKEPMLFYYLFTEIFLMVDSRAKNMFLSTFDGVHWMPLPYDMDTALGINNEGALVFDYDLEDTDTVNDAAVFNGQDSVLWINVRTVFYDEIAEMYDELRDSGALSYETLNNKFRNHQNAWPEALWNEDAYEKYLEPLVNDNDESYLEMLQGNKDSQRDWWLFNGFRYRDSKYQTGDAITQYIMIRCYAVGDITIKPYSHIWPAIKYGSYLITERGKRNTEYTLECPLDKMNDTEVFIYSADRIAEIGDLSHLIVGYADFSRATKLQKLLLGSNASDYTNEKLTFLSVGNNELLTELNIQNCTALASSINLSGCASINKVLAGGSAILGLSLPNGGHLETLELPASMTNLSILNQKMLTNFSLAGYDNLEIMHLEGTPCVPVEAIVNGANKLTRVRLVNMEWTATDETSLQATINKLKNCKGSDATGTQELAKAVVIGRVNVPSISENLLAEINDEFPELIVVTNGVPNYLVRYLNYDGTLVHREVVMAGANAIDPVANGTILAPTKPGTDETGFSFKDWGALPTNIQGNVSVVAQYYDTYAVKYLNYDGSLYHKEFVVVGEDAIDPVANGTVTAPTRPATDDIQFAFRDWGTLPTNIQAVTSVTAQYSNTYAVRYKNYDGAVLQTKWVAEGGSTNYTGSTPTRPATAQYKYTFSTWSNGSTNGAISNVATATNLTAQYSSEIQKYTVYFYSGSTLLQTVPNVSYGTSATYTGETPTKTDVTDPENYPFIGWSPAPTNIQANTTCYAQFESPLEIAEITDDWDTIRKNVAAGVYRTKYKVGNYKALDLGTEGAVTMQIVAFDTDDLADGSGKAPITWIARELLTTSKAMNPALVSKKTISFDPAGTYLWNAVADTQNSYESTNAGKGGTTSTGCWKITSESAGTLSIAYTQSGENSYDYMDLYVDGVAAFAGKGKGQDVSGTYNVALTPGAEVTVLAVFTKDSSGDKGDDKGMVTFSADVAYNVEVPSATTSITVPAQEGTGSIGGWEKTQMRTYVQETIKALMPANVSGQLAPVLKTTKAFNTAETGFQQTTIDDVWIPNHREIFASSSYDTSGPMYSTVYSDAASRVKMKVGASSAGIWWLRSASSAGYFGYVGSSGDGNGANAGITYGVALGFSTGRDTITDSWEQIFQSIDDGTYATKYSIGDTKTIDLGAEGKICAQIAAFDADDLADGSGKAPITWVCEELLVTSKRMNPSRSGSSGAYTEGTGTIGGWEKTEMRTYVNETMKAALPEAIRNRIKTVTKHTVGYNSAEVKTQYTTQDDVWIPSYREVFGGTSYDTEGPVYSGLFTSATTRKKQKYGASSADTWWLRSASSTGNFSRVISSGGASGDNAYSTNGVALGFCM